MGKDLTTGLAVAALMIVSAAILKYAESANLIGSAAATRTAQVMTGLILSIYGNFMPKILGRWRPVAARRTQISLRIGGWSMALAGLAYAAIWAMAPLAMAGTASMAAVAPAFAVLLGCFAWMTWTCVTHRGSQQDPAP